MLDLVGVCRGLSDDGGMGASGDSSGWLLGVLVVEGDTMSPWKRVRRTAGEGWVGGSLLGDGVWKMMFCRCSDSLWE